MKKYLFNGVKEVVVGDVVDYLGFNCKLTDKVISLNPTLFVDISTPEYLKCINVNTMCKTWTLNKVYPLINNKDYPRIIDIIDDNGGLRSVGNWTKDYIDKGNNCFEPVGKNDYKDYLIETTKTMFPVGSTVSNNNLGYDCEFEITNNSRFLFREGELNISVEVKTGHFLTIYKDGKWAETVKKVLCLDENGLEIFENDKYLVVDVEYRKWICVSGNIENKPNRHIFKNEDSLNTWINSNKDVK